MLPTAAGKGALHSMVFSLLRKLVSTFNRKSFEEGN